MSGRTRKTFTGGQRAVQRGQTAAGVEKVGLLCDLPEQGAAFLTVQKTQ